MSSKYKKWRGAMVIRSLEQPVYYRNRRGGLPGAGLKAKGVTESPLAGKSFEEYLTEAFQGEVVQEGNWYSNRLTEMGRKNLSRI